MNVLARIASTATALLFLTSVGSAQQMTAPQTATVGEGISISYSNPAKANQTIVIQVLDDEDTEVATLEIQLDAAGQGNVNWTVLGMSGLGFDFVADDASTSTAIDV